MRGVQAGSSPHCKARLAGLAGGNTVGEVIGGGGVGHGNGRRWRIVGGAARAGRVRAGVWMRSERDRVVSLATCQQWRWARVALRDEQLGVKGCGV